MAPVFSPLPPDELAAIIYEACGEDLSTASLTQVGRRENHGKSYLLSIFLYNRF